MSDDLEHDLTTMEGRVAAVCEWCDRTPPVLTPDPDEPDAMLVTDDLVAWMRDASVDFDWLMVGDTKGLVLADRRERQKEREFIGGVRELDAEGLRILKVGMEVMLRDDVPGEQALAASREVVAEHRAKRAGEAA